MRKLVLTSRFRRAYKKFVRRDRRLQTAIDAALEAMSQDIFVPFLNTHKLRGCKSITPHIDNFMH